MTRQISTSISSGWLNLDAWSETYVGVHWLVTNELPQHPYEAEPRHGPLSQMVLLGSHHLVEVMLFQCIKRLLENNVGKFPILEEKYDRAHFFKAFSDWPEVLVGAPFHIEDQPLKSAIALANRRTATVHKESALTTLGMARSAQFTAVHSSRAIAIHLLGKNGFKYEQVLQKYPLPDAPWFSNVQLVDEPREAG